MSFPRICFPIIAAFLTAGLFTGCATLPSKQSEEDFLKQYEPYLGHAYAGRSVLVDLGENHPLDGASLLMMPEAGGPGEVRIRFFVNDDRSRTWILRQTGRGLHLSHDHRREDGSEYPQNFYGGYADGRGDARKQFFPADERTIRDRPIREINLWSKEFDLENGRYLYRLRLRGELRYEAEFDLTNPLPLPERE